MGTERLTAPLLEEPAERCHLLGSLESLVLNRISLCSHQGSLGIVLASERLFLIP